MEPYEKLVVASCEEQAGFHALLNGMESWGLLDVANGERQTHFPALETETELWGPFALVGCK